MNLKRKLVMGIASVTTTFLVGSTVLAADFSDVTNGFWAYDTIKQMSEHNIIVGYTDGSFKPSKPVSRVEVLVVLARILGVNSEDNIDMIESGEQNYSSTLEKYDTYATKELSFLLEKGVLLEDELDTYLADGNGEESMARFEVVPLIVRIMGQEEEVASRSLVVLNYKDSDSIPQEIRADVQYLGEVGLMGTATDDNRFLPEGSITRAQIATLASRVMDIMTQISDDEKEEPTETIIDEEVPAVEEQLQPDVTGLVQTVKTDYVLGRKIISVTTTIDGVDTTIDYPVAAKAEVVVNGLTAHVTKIGADYLSKLYLNDSGEAYKIIADQKERKFEGTIESVDLINNTITINDGSQTIKYVINSEVIIVKDGANSDINNIRKGNKASVYAIYENLSSLTLISESSQLEGVIEEVVISRNPRLLIKKDDGTLQTCQVNNNASIKIFDETAEIYDLRPGYRVALLFDSQETIVIDAMQQINGTISSFEIDYREVELTPDDKSFGASVQLLISDNTKYINDQTGSEISLNGLDINQKVIAIGKLVKSKLYVKEIIIVE